jgi:phospholipid/cholesterol/gamma-HCH transport system ATP-binding protein
LVKIESLYTILGGKVIHRNLNCQVEKGKTTVIIGRSGCGKSVLLKALTRLISPYSGKIIFEGQDIAFIKEKYLTHMRLKIGFVFQGAALFDSMNIYDNVGFALKKIKKFTEIQVIKKVDELLEWVGLRGIGKMIPGELSGGMRKRVGIARAIAMEPELILFDEPTTGLDPIMTDVIDNLVNRLKHEKKMTSIVVTHDMKSAYKIADYIYMMEDGIFMGEGDVQAIQNTTDPKIRQFIEGKAEGPIKV